MNQTFRNPLPRRFVIERKVQTVAYRHGIGPKDIWGWSRFPHISKARHEVWADLHRGGMSYSEIARQFNRDHTSVRYGVLKHNGGDQC